MSESPGGSHSRAWRSTWSLPTEYQKYLNTWRKVVAINISMGPRSEVDRTTQAIARTFVGYDPSLTDDQLWNVNRGAWVLPEGADQEQFATLSYDGIIRIVAEIEGVENLTDADGNKVQALLGRVLRRGDAVRDALVGQQVKQDGDVALFDTAELDEMPPAVRYANSDRPVRTFLMTYKPEEWFWSPEDEASVVSRTMAGGTVRETWSAGGRRDGIEPGDRVYLLQRGEGPHGMRGRGVVTSRVYQAEHWDDPSREANFIEIQWDLVLPVERLIDSAVLQSEVPGYAWNPQKPGVELHQPMADQMEQLWLATVGAEAHPQVEADSGWEVFDSRRRQVRSVARERMRTKFETEGWEVLEVGPGRPYDAVATRGDEHKYLFGRAAETAGRPVMFGAEELQFASEHPDDCVLAIASDCTFNGGNIDPESGTVVYEDFAGRTDAFEPVLYRYWPAASEAGRRGGSGSPTA